MKLYKCTRYPYSDIGEDEWMGALIIFADSPEEAKEIFSKFEYGNTEPKQIIELKIEKGVIHDDFMR